MNERLLELAKQANANELSYAYYRGEKKPENAVTLHSVDLEKFAELIVRECIGCCEQVISDPVPKSVDTWLNGGEQCIQEIKEHFGVTE